MANNRLSMRKITEALRLHFEHNRTNREIAGYWHLTARHAACNKPTLQAIIRGHVEVSTVIHSDGWRGYDGLVDIGFDKYFRVNHSNNEFANGERHINEIESFWSYAKRRLVKFNGVAKHTFYLHLKETEFRFNHRRANLYLEVLKLLRNKPL